jgi:hypothetical protein
MVLAQTGICSVDGKGRIFYADNFHGGLSGFEPSYAGDGKYPYPSTTHTYIPPLSLGLNPGTSNGSGASWVTKWLTVPDTEKLGLEVMAAAGNDHAVIYEIQLWYCYKDGSGYDWVVGWNTSNGQVFFYSDGQPVILDTYYINSTGWIWTPVKIVGNITQGKWDRLLVGNRGYNLSSYIPNRPSMVTKGLLLVYLMCYPAQASTSGDFGRYGYMILTIDEP